MQSTSSSSRRYLLQEAVLFLVLSYWLIFASSTGGLLNKGMLTVSSALLTAVALVWIVTGARRVGRVTPFVLLFAAVLLLTAFTSIDPARSIPEVWLIGLELLTLLLTIDLVGRGWPAELFVKVLLLVGVIISLFSWLDFIAWYRAWLGTNPAQWIPAASYRLPAPNMLAVMLNLLLMAALARLLTVRSWGTRIALGLYALSSLALLYLTSSRGGWLGTAAGLFVLALLNTGYLRIAVNKIRGFLQPRRWLLLPGLALVLVVVLAAGFMLYKQAQQPTHGSILTSRTGLWGPAWQLFTQSPWIGAGPFTFAAAYLGWHTVPPGLIYVYAHNLYLDVLSSSGVLGLIAFLLLAGIIIYALLRRLRTTSGDERAVVVGAIAALAAFGVHGLFDSVHHTEPTVAFTLALLLGAALGTSPGAPQRNPRPGYARWMPLLALPLVGFAWYNLWALQPFYGGAAQANAGQWTSAAESFSQAVARSPRSAAAYQQLGLTQAELAADGDASALDDAIASFEQVTKLDPYFGLHFADLGALYLARGDTSAAVAAMQQAVDLAPGSALFQLNLGMAAEAAGDEGTAYQAYSQALEITPAWAKADFWQASPLRERALADCTCTLPQPPLSELKAAYSANRSSPATYIALARAYLDAGRLEDAAGVLQQSQFATVVSTFDFLQLTELRRDLAYRQGDTQAFQELDNQVSDAYAHQGLYGPGSFGIRTYTPYVLRKPAMAMELVPQLYVMGEVDTLTPNPSP
jgi:putative inorganic carbon (HCO3(-)) transporter